MAEAKGSLDYWRKFFSSVSSDIFEPNEKAILVAAVDCPNEFNDRKDHIAEKLYTPPLSPPFECQLAELQIPNNGDTDPNDKSQIVKEVMRIKKVLSNSQNESYSSLHESLKSLQLMPLPVETLIATEIGRTVNDLRKHGSSEIRNLVRTLIDGWKSSVDEWVDSSPSITDHTVTASVSSLLNKSSATDSNSPLMNKSKQRHEVSYYVSKLEITKRKLHAGYQREENAKKRRMIQVIQPRDIPKDSHEKGRPKKKPENLNGN